MTTMKKYISFLFAALLCGTSCTDTRTDYMMGDTAYFPKSDLQEETLYVMNANDYVYDIWIHKAGYFQDKFAGKVELDYNYMVQYNTNNGTDYEMLDQKYYSFNGSFVIEVGADEIAVPLNLKIEELLKDKGYGVYYIPFSVNSLTPKEEVYVDKAHFILVMNIRKPLLMIDGTEGEQLGEITVDLSKSTAERVIDITAKLNVTATEDLVVTYGYNKDEDDMLTPEELQHILPAGFEYEKSVTIPVGGVYAENSLKLKPEDMPDGMWILPVRLGTANDKVGSDENANWLKVKIIKGSLDNKVTVKGDHVQGGDVILSSEETLSGEQIAEIAANTDLSWTVEEKGGGQPSWLTVNKTDDKISVTVTSKNTSVWQERVATITLRDEETWLEKEIIVRQGIKDCGILLNKSLWSIVGFSNVEGKEGTLVKLFDNFWPATKEESFAEYQGSANSFIEVSKGSEAVPVQIVLDLGENPHTYNAIGLMPRLQWTGNSPKYMKIEVADEMSSGVITRNSEGEDATTWTLVGDAKRNVFDNSFVIKNDAYKENLFIGWNSLGEDMNHRYIRISLWESYSGTICLDEIFVTKK